MLNIIIPTKNRENELTRLLEALNKSYSVIDKVIIVDSSDKIFKNLNLYKNLKITYEHTDIKSAAIQRNIGMSLVSDRCKFLAFLDDDVIPNQEYFDELIDTLLENKAVGVSGLAINPKKSKQNYQNNFLKLTKRLFYLDSKKMGTVLSSGVNIPINLGNNLNKIVQTQWLIGCALWDYQAVRNLRFDNRLFGQSLGEDVLFSLKASKIGLLFVNTHTILEHTESINQRPGQFNFYRMWIRNRYFIVKELANKKAIVAFHWCNIGKVLILFALTLKSPFKSLGGISGIIAGYIDLAREPNAK